MIGNTPQRVPLLCLIALTVVGLGASPVSAGHEGIHPTFKTQQVYFTCPAPVTNAAGWSTASPDGMLFRNGCGENVIESTEYRVWAACADDPDCRPVCEQTVGGQEFPCRFGSTTFSGTFRGNLRNLTLHLHVMPFDHPFALSYRPDIRLSIDGQLVGSRSTEVFCTSGTLRCEISFLALGCAREVRDDHGDVVDVIYDGLASEDGTGSKLRSIEVSVVQNSERVLVWGAGEFAAGITFNPATLATNWSDTGLAYCW